MLKPPDAPYVPIGESPSYEGPEGPPGPAGADGEPGADGAQGAQGPMGPAGSLNITDTADTFEPYRIIMLAEGNQVKAIPAAWPAPAMPASPTVTVRLSSVRFAWTAAPTGSTYQVYRDSAELVETSQSSYRDLTVEPGETYDYQVQTIDVYGQRSAVTEAISAFIDPALNVAPLVEITAWPASFPSDGRTILRVNAADANAHALELALEVDAGTIEATDDPSVWIYTP